MTEVDLLTKRLDKEKRRVTLLEKIIEDRTRDLYLANQSLEARTAELEELSAKLEERVQERTAKLWRSNKELEQFAYIASHDLQEPLRMVASFGELLALRYQGKLDDKADRYIHFMVEGACRMQALINDLLAYSRVSSKAKPLEPVDGNKVLESALENKKITLGESHADIVSDRLPVVFADRLQLVQVFQNLVGNAIKFHGEEPPKVRVSAERDGDRWIITVADNGIGIEETYTERIFQIFQRLHQRGEYEGTGIGLAIVKKIVEREGGRIWVESEPGAGARFRFTLPALGKKRETGDGETH